MDTKVLENPSGLSCGGGPAPQAPGKCETNDEAWYAIKLNGLAGWYSNTNQVMKLNISSQQRNLKLSLQL